MKSKLYIAVLIVLFLISPLYIAADAKVVESTLSEMETVVADYATTEESSAVRSKTEQAVNDYLTTGVVIAEMEMTTERGINGQTNTPFAV